MENKTDWIKWGLVFNLMVFLWFHVFKFMQEPWVLKNKKNKQTGIYKYSKSLLESHL